MINKYHELNWIEPFDFWMVNFTFDARWETQFKKKWTFKRDTNIKFIIKATISSKRVIKTTIGRILDLIWNYVDFNVKTWFRLKKSLPKNYFFSSNIFLMDMQISE